MLTRDDILNRRDEIIAVARRNGASDVRIFGSVARGDTTATSDLDLIVRFEPGRNLMDYGMLIEELQDLLGIKVDVVSEGALNGRSGVRDQFAIRVLQEAVPL